MPETATITAFTTFAANTTAKSSEVNANFGNFRGIMIPISTDTITSSDATHDLGAADHRWKDGYFSGVAHLGVANTVGGWRITLGATTTELNFDFFSATAYVNKGQFTSAGNPGVETVVSTSGAYTVVSSDDVVLGNATAAAFTLTLPTAVGITGKTYTFIKVDSNATIVTVDGNGTETIKGQTNYKLASQFESAKMISDGSNWQVTANDGTLGRWAAFTPTGSLVTNVTYTGQSRRNGQNVDYQVKIAYSGAPTNTSIEVNLPSDDVIDTTVWLHDNPEGSPSSVLGTADLIDATSSNNTFLGRVSFQSTTQVGVEIHRADGTYTRTVEASTTAPFTFASGDIVELVFSVPIVRFRGF